jgi:hypothetical protein
MGFETIGVKLEAITFGGHKSDLSIACFFALGSVRVPDSTLTFWKVAIPDLDQSSI